MSEHARYIRRAIELARQARGRGNHPFGAVLVVDSQIALEAENTVVAQNDPTRHAEMNLVRLAWQELPSEAIARSTLYTSTEPCPMCVGAIFWSGIRRVVFSFPALDLGALAGDRFCGPCKPLFDRADQKTEVIGPVLADEGREVHLGFWTKDQAATFSLRMATLGDAPVLEGLIADSARGLCREDYTDAQIEAALGTAWGLDTELIRDGTYFVAEAGGEIVACGGWSRRRTLFGGDKQAGRHSELLDAGRDSARIRAFFVRPDWARLGIGRALIERCEAEAQAHGFRSVELVATLAGHRLYRACGYAGDERREYPLSDGITIEFVPMKKELA